MKLAVSALKWRYCHGEDLAANVLALHAASRRDSQKEIWDVLFICGVSIVLAICCVILDRSFNRKDDLGLSSDAERVFRPTQPSRAAAASSSDQEGAGGSFMSEENPISKTVSKLFVAPMKGFIRGESGSVTPVNRGKEDILEEIMSASCLDQLWILRRLAENHGRDVLQQALLALDTRHQEARHDIMLTRSVSEPEDCDDMQTDHIPQLRFSSLQYYAEEGENLVVRVVRVGDLSSHTSVRYQTREASAKAYVNYEPVDGILDFAPEEFEKDIMIQINENDFYGPSLELTVELKETGLDNGRLDKDLWQARIEIMDNDAFPTNLYQKLIDPEELVKDDSIMYNLDKTRLLVEYIRFCLDDPTIYWGMLRMVMIDQVENVFGLLNLFMSVYLVDFVVVKAVSEKKLLFQSREMCLCMVTALILVPQFGLHYFNWKKNFWGVTGRARTVIQTALLRKFLDYSDDVRAKIHHGDIILATTADSYCLVNQGLMKMLVFCKQMGAVFMLILFQFAAPIIFNRPFRIWLLCLMFLVPGLMFVVSHLRFNLSTLCLEQQFETEARLAELVHETVVCYPLIADYNRRPIFVERFGKAISNNNKSCVNVATTLANNSFMAGWVTLLFVGLFTFGGGMLVIQGTMTLGIFLANVRIFGEVGKTCENVYSTWLEMQQVLPPLLRVTRLLNLPIDIDERKALAEERESLSRTKAAKLPSQGRREGMDMMPIVMHDINISFHTSDKPISLIGKVEITPGSLVTVVGPRNSGKSTFLKILGGAILPNPEDLFIPSHLTILHVDPDPIFFTGTLMDNLLFGHNGHKDAVARNRVLRICQRLGLTETVMAMVHGNQVLPWGNVLSFSQKSLISLARALVANPHVLLVHRPVDFLEEDAQRAVITTLREFVERRGLEQDDPFSYRSPHTCVMTTAAMVCLEMSDAVICVSGVHGIKNVSKEEASGLMKT